MRLTSDPHHNHHLAPCQDTGSANVLEIFLMFVMSMSLNNTLNTLFYTQTRWGWDMWYGWIV